MTNPPTSTKRCGDAVGQPRQPPLSTEGQPARSLSAKSGAGRWRHDLTRRDFVSLGSLSLAGAGGLASALGLILGDGRDRTTAWANPVEAQPSGASVAVAKSSRAASVILIFLGGGLSHHDSFDPKPDAPAEIRGPYKTIPTAVTGLHFGERLPQLARLADRFALIRSGHHNNDHHETATNWVLSGRFGSAFGDYPAMGAVAAHQLGFAGTLPPYVAVPRNPSFTWELGRSAFLGGRYESFKTGDPAAPSFAVPDLAPPTNNGAALTTQRQTRRRDLLAAVDDLTRRIEHNDHLATHDEFARRAAEIVASPAARAAFDLSGEPDALRDRYGRHTFGQGCLLARRLVEAGVRFVTVNYAGWDHHAKIFPGLDKKLPELDGGLSALIEDMTARGTATRTLVAVFGEFGRTPKINKDAGRDHWGAAGSLVFFGAGVRGGLVLGATDKTGADVTARPVSPGDVAATIYTALGINPDTMLVTPDGRPLHILDSGAPVAELWS